VKKLIAILSLAFVGSAFAAEETHNWFDTELPKIGSSRTWPSDGSDYEGYNCTITNTAAGVYTDGAVVIDAESPMKVCPYVSNTVYETRVPSPAQIGEEHYIDVVAEMKMEPFDASDLPEIPAEMKVGVIVVDSGDATNFWVTAGTETLYWTNTMIAADVEELLTVKVQVRTNDQHCTCTEWKLGVASQGLSDFVCTVRKITEINGVAFSGEGEIANCYGDRDKGLTFVSFWFEPIPDEIVVTVTNASGEVIVQSGIGDYQCLDGKQVFATYSLPPNWRFYDGSLQKSESFIVAEGPHVPLESGIFETDFGPENGWMTVGVDEEGNPVLIARYASLAEAVAELKDGYVLLDCYSETGHEVAVAADGSSVTIDGVPYAVKARYHYVDVEGVAMLEIDEAEKVITSFGESSDPTQMSVGSILNSCPDFDYSVVYGDDVAFSENPGETEPVSGNGGKLELVAPKGENGKRFYKIRITDQQITE